MHSIEPAPEYVAETATRRRFGKKGFTLVEVMVATGLLVMVGLGILTVMIGAYRVAAKARYRDHARFVIKSLADQFLTQQSSDPITGVTYTLFVPTPNNGSGVASPSGTGISWTNTDGTAGSLTTDTTGYQVYLGDNTGAPITATVSRTVSYLYPNTGAATLDSQSQPAGDLLEGVFTVSYPYLGQTVTQTIIAVRATP